MILFYTIPKYGITIPKWMVYQNILYYIWDCEDPEKTSGWSFPSHRRQELNRFFRHHVVGGRAHCHGSTPKLGGF